MVIGLYFILYTGKGDCCLNIGYQNIEIPIQAEIGIFTKQWVIDAKKSTIVY